MGRPLLPSGIIQPQYSERYKVMVNREKASTEHLGHTSIGHAVSQLSKETERGEHRPSVGGYHDHNHDGKCESTGCV